MTCRFLLTLKTNTKIIVKLTQNQPIENLYHIGIYVARTEGSTRLLSLTSKELVEKTKFQNVKEGKDVIRTFSDIPSISGATIS